MVNYMTFFGWNFLFSLTFLNLPDVPCGQHLGTRCLVCEAFLQRKYYAQCFFTNQSNHEVITEVFTAFLKATLLFFKNLIYTLILW